MNGLSEALDDFFQAVETREADQVIAILSIAARPSVYQQARKGFEQVDRCLIISPWLLGIRAVIAGYVGSR